MVGFMPNQPRRFVFACLILQLAACGDMLMGNPYQDAGWLSPDSSTVAPPDAGPDDVDGGLLPEPWEPTDPIIPGDPCEIVSDLPEVAYDADMANYAIRFKDGQGLELSPDLRQAGLLEAENADIDKRDAVEKRLGADVLGDTRSTTPGDVVPDDARRAIWPRGKELLLQTERRIYSQKQATTGFVWRDVGSWTQMRLRETYANVFPSGVLNADAASVGGATTVAYELDQPSNEVRFAVYQDGAREFEEILASGASRPRLSILGTDSVLITYQLGSGSFPLIAKQWNLGDEPPTNTIAPAPFTVMPAVPGVWDVHSVTTDVGDEVTAWAAEQPPGDISVSVRMGSVIGTGTIAGGDPFGDVAVSVWPRRVAGNIRVVTTHVAPNIGNWRITVVFWEFNPATSALVGSTSTSIGLADTANVGRAVALSWFDRDNISIAVEQSGDAPDNFRKVTYYTMVRGSPPTPTGIVHNYTSLVTQGAIAAGTPVDTLVSAGAEPLVPAFVEQLQSNVASGSTVARNGWVMFAPRTGEVLARSFVGYTGNKTTRAARPAKGSLITNGTDITWAGPASVLSEPGGTLGNITVSADLNAIATCRLDRTQYPNAPANADGSVVSAHAGYPRVYDGTSLPFEHDWHTLPRITGQIVPGSIAGPTTAGTHSFAVQLEHDDANGLRYRSAPSFFGPQSIGGPLVSFKMTVEAFTHTERVGARWVVWMTANNSPVFRRVGEFPINGLVQDLEFAIEDATLATRETLDQGGVPATQGITPGERARVTDFMTNGDDRLFSRDPLKESLVRFSIPSREASGFAQHWPLAFVVEEPDERKVTAVAEVDGRIVVGSELGLALLTADGPDATGAGTFGNPTVLRAEMGVEAQEQLARTPLGYVFGTRDGDPKLLTPGLTVQDIARPVERNYKIDGANVVAITYDQNREEIVFLANSGKTLRFNTGTNRWASDPNRLGRDLTVTKQGDLYLIRSDGKVLKQREDVWADGGVGYALKVSTPWIRDMSRDATVHSSFRLGEITVAGEYLGPHTLFFDVYKDFNDVTPWATYQVPQADVVQNAADNKGWIYGVRLGGRDSFLGARIVVRDGAEPNRTFRLSHMDIDVITDGSSKQAERRATQYATQIAG